MERSKWARDHSGDEGESVSKKLKSRRPKSISSKGSRDKNEAAISNTSTPTSSSHTPVQPRALFKVVVASKKDNLDADMVGLSSFQPDTFPQPTPTGWGGSPSEKKISEGSQKLPGFSSSGSNAQNEALPKGEAAGKYANNALGEHTIENIDDEEDGSEHEHPVLVGCRSVENYEKLNRISEGAYGVVYRARDRVTGDIVALKKLKLDQEKNGFPVTSLREVYTLLLAKHVNIVNVREIVVGDTLTQIFIVMDFIEHDLKDLMSEMKQPFLQSEVKTLMLQLLSATKVLHENWILHRDLKTSNLLLNNKGEIKVADFGLARRYGEPQGTMTQPVVTLWYRSPELLLGTKHYTTAVDMWSIGCIFAEFVNNEPLMPGRGEPDQLEKIFRLLGAPTEKIWPGFSKLPLASQIPATMSYPHSTLKSRFPYLTENGRDLMARMLTYDPARRISAEDALQHAYFSESPPPKHPSMFPTWPSKGERAAKKGNASPSAPQAIHGNDEEDKEGFAGGMFNFANQESTAFRLKI